MKAITRPAIIVATFWERTPNLGPTAVSTKVASLANLAVNAPVLFSFLSNQPTSCLSIAYLFQYWLIVGNATLKHISRNFSMRRWPAIANIVDCVIKQINGANPIAAKPRAHFQECSLISINGQEVPFQDDFYPLEFYKINRPFLRTK